MPDFQKTLERQGKELNRSMKHVRDHVGDLGDLATAVVAALLLVAARLEVLTDSFEENIHRAGEGF